MHNSNNNYYRNAYLTVKRILEWVKEMMCVKRPTSFLVNGKLRRLLTVEETNHRDVDLAERALDVRASLPQCRSITNLILHVLDDSCRHEDGQCVS